MAAREEEGVERCRKRRKASHLRLHTVIPQSYYCATVGLVLQLTKIDGHKKGGRESERLHECQPQGRQISVGTTKRRIMGTDRKHHMKTRPEA